MKSNLGLRHTLPCRLPHPVLRLQPPRQRLWQWAGLRAKPPSGLELPRFPPAPLPPLCWFIRASGVFLLNCIHVSEGDLSPASAITANIKTRVFNVDLCLNQQCPVEYFKRVFSVPHLWGLCLSCRKVTLVLKAEISGCMPVSLTLNSGSPSRAPVEVF